MLWKKGKKKVKIKWGNKSPPGNENPPRNKSPPGNKSPLGNKSPGIKNLGNKSPGNKSQLGNKSPGNKSPTGDESPLGSKNLGNKSLTNKIPFQLSGGKKSRKKVWESKVRGIKVLQPLESNFRKKLTECMVQLLKVS